jgi:hypothetical protein
MSNIMSAEGKKNHQYTRELHFVVPLPIDEVVEYLSDLGKKDIRVTPQRATPEEHKLRLEYWDEIQTTVYMRLSVWNASETRIEMSLSNGFHISPKIYIPAVLIVSVMFWLEWLTDQRVIYSLILLTAALIYMGFLYFRFSHEGRVSNSQQDMMESRKFRKNAGYVMDAVVELFKKEGAAILLERSTDEDLYPLDKSKFVAEIMREDDVNRSEKSTRG